MERRRSISQSCRCTRDAKERLGTPANPATDALSAISVWRALDADRSIRVLFDEGEDYLLAELTFVSGHFDDAMNDLVELCADHGFTMSCACCLLPAVCCLLSAVCCLLSADQGQVIAFSAVTRNSLAVLPLGLAIPGAVPPVPAVRPADVGGAGLREGAAPPGA